MSKPSFNWKSLFVNEEPQAESESKKADVPVTSDTKFPSQVTNSVTTDPSANPFINEVVEVYEKGFASLNSAEFDFYELYRSVMVVGPGNPQSYQMAFTMGKSLKPDLSKQFLLDKAKYYSDEIEKVYSKYNDAGNAKIKDLNDTVVKQKDDLSKTIHDLETKIIQLQNELMKSKSELEKIDFNNKEKYTELQLKLDANNVARKKILDSINQVVAGVNQYL